MNSLTTFSIILICFIIFVNAKGKKGSKGRSGSSDNEAEYIPLNDQYPTQILLFNAHNHDLLNGLIVFKEIELSKDVVSYLNHSDTTDHFNRGTKKIHQVTLQLRSMPMGSYKIAAYDRGNLLDGCSSLGDIIAVFGNQSDVIEAVNSSITHSITVRVDRFQMAGKRSVIGKSLALVNIRTGSIECCGVIAYTHEHSTVTYVNPMIYAALTSICVLLCLLTGCVCYTVDKSSGSEKKQTAAKGTKMEAFDNHGMDLNQQDRFTVELKTKFNTAIFTQPPTLVERNFNTRF